MGRINSRTKGNSFENKVAKLIVTAFEDFGVTKADCYRTPSSGGHRYAKKEDPGDLVISDKLYKLGFRFSVEAKHHREVQLWPLLIPHEKQLSAWKFKPWMNQTIAAAKKTKLTAMLVFKGNGRMPIMCGFPLRSVSFSQELLTENRICYLRRGVLWCFIKFDDFLRLFVEDLCRKK